MELFKLHVENLGAIREAELSIRPLTVFFGPNNTNKTWTAYALYALAKQLSTGRSRLWQLNELRSRHGIEVDGNIEQLGEEAAERASDAAAVASPDAALVQELKRSEFLPLMNYPIHVRLLPDGLARLLVLPGRLTLSSSVTVTISEGQFQRSAVESASASFDDSGRVVLETVDSQGSPIARTIYSSRHEQPGELLRAKMRDVVEGLLLGIFRSVVAIPAERKALVTVYNVLPDFYPGMVPIPVVDFVDMLKFCQTRETTGRGYAEFDSPIAALEGKILQGRIGFDREAGEAQGGMKYAQVDGPALQVHAASSFVRAIAGLDVYLRLVAGPKDLIVIDEPEMNAHPEAQLMVSELLGILVNQGISVVITTHSPYIVDHINNLTEAAHLPEAKQEEIATRFKLGTKDAFVALDQVAAYEFHEDGRVTDAVDRKERIIGWSSFGERSEYVTNLYNRILEATAPGTG